jgi:hypothetical protein
MRFRRHQMQFDLSSSFHLLKTRGLLARSKVITKKREWSEIEDDRVAHSRDEYNLEGVSIYESKPV